MREIYINRPSVGDVESGIVPKVYVAHVTYCAIY